jgi:hypothetical protein
VASKLGAITVAEASERGGAVVVRGAGGVVAVPVGGVVAGGGVSLSPGSSAGWASATVGQNSVMHIKIRFIVTWLAMAFPACPTVC